jgi:hypothetical protein
MFGGANASGSTNTPQNFSESAFNNIKNATNSNMGLVVIVGVMFFVIVYVMIYIFKQYNTTALKTVTMLKKPVKVPENKFINISEESGLPTLSYINGKEFSYSFWMYIEGESFQQTSKDKFVLGRLKSGDNLSSASPSFTLSKNSNTLKVQLYKENNGSGNPEAHEALVINYVPLQRWVNVVLVVDNNFVQLFMDGELRQVTDLTKYANDSSVVKTPVGNLYIGSNTQTPSFNGYISKVQAFNYAVTIDHAKVIYKAGPLHRTVLSVIGIDTYGIQNPFYRIDEKNQVKENCNA